MINLFGPINYLGMGIHSYNMGKALDNMGKEICLFPPFGDVYYHNNLVDKWLLNQSKFKTSNPSLMIFDSNFMAHFAGKLRIGFVVFETDFIPSKTVHIIKQCDMVATPSEWGKGILERHHIKSIKIPEGYDPEIYEICFSNLDVYKRDAEIKFLHVGKFEGRKGTLELIQAFSNALSGKNARLLMQIFSPFVKDYSALDMELKFFKFKRHLVYENLFFNGDLKIEILSHDVSFQDMARRYQLVDCTVFPTKGEAWGLPILESIACGTPAIVGNWTGQTEYLGKDWPDCLSLKGTQEIADDGVWYKKDKGTWYKPSQSDLMAKIHWAYHHVRKYRQSEEWKKCVQRIRSFTWSNAAFELLKK